jgi:hypothetical protein
MNRLLIGILVSLFWPLVALAEPVSPSVHWGALAYPDTQQTLTADFTVNYFTQFSGRGVAGGSYNPVQETIGLNFATLSWTEHWKGLQGWSTNLTVGAGPTREEPGRSIQNGIHDTFDFARVPVGKVRETTDFMIDGSVTKWADLLGAKKTGFAGVGVSSGSVYHEVFGRLGVRRAFLIPGVSFIRWSAMGRVSQLWDGAVFRQVAPQSYLGQLSLALGDYTESNQPGFFELEVGITIDSGLFVGFGGNTLEEKFVAFAIRFPWLTFEMWNDSWAPPKYGDKDNGPTGGGRLMLDLLRIAASFK